MSEQRLKGLLSIEIADLPVGGGVPLEADWDVVGKTYRDEATLTEDDATTNDHFSNEADDPEESDMVAGKKKLKFSLIDFTAATLVKYLGGTATGTAPAQVWNAPASKTAIEKAFRLKSKNGYYITLPRVSFIGKVDYTLSPTGIAKVIVDGTVLAPTDGTSSSVIKGTVAG